MTNMDVTDARMAELVSTEAGRVTVMKHLSVTEGAAVIVLREILKDLSDTALRKLANKHLTDELKHESMLLGHLDRLGIQDVPERAQKLSALLDMWSEMDPKTVSERYSVLRVVEENDSLDFSRLSEAVRQYDPIAADIYAEMARDEANHLHYCDAAIKRLGDPLRLVRYRDIYHNRLEVYDRARHFAQIDSWGEELDPSGLGLGYVIRGRACGFVGCVSGTRTAYFYSLRANPQIGLIERGRAIMRIAKRIISDCKAAGLNRAVTTTANPVIQRFWTERMGLKRSSELLLEGTLSWET